MRFSDFEVKTKPAALPVTPDEYVNHARLNGITVQRQPELLNRELSAATKRAEEYLRRSLLTQSLRARYLPGGMYSELIQLIRGKVLGVTSVTLAGNPVPPEGYRFDEWDTIVLLNGAPSEVVIVEWESGYGPAAEDVPALIREGILEYATTLYHDRGGTREIKATADVGAPLPPGVKDTWEPFRVPLPRV